MSDQINLYTHKRKKLLNKEFIKKNEELKKDLIIQKEKYKKKRNLIVFLL